MRCWGWLSHCRRPRSSRLQPQQTGSQGILSWFPLVSPMSKPKKCSLKALTLLNSHQRRNICVSPKFDFLLHFLYQGRRTRQPCFCLMYLFFTSVMFHQSLISSSISCIKEGGQDNFVFVWCIFWLYLLFTTVISCCNHMFVIFCSLQLYHSSTILVIIITILSLHC